MKIGYESTTLWKPKKTGVDVYATELVRHLIPLLDPKKDTIYLSYFSLPHRPSVNLTTSSGHYKDRRIWYFPLKIYNQFYKYFVTLPFDLMAWGAVADVYIFPNYFRWPVVSKHSIVVIHDLTFKTRPQYLTEKSRWSLDHGVPKSMAKADAVVAVSEFTRLDIIREYGIDPKKVHTVPNAVDLSVFTPSPDDAVTEVKERFSITKEYLFFLSTLEPRKNLVGLLHAYEMLPAATRAKYALVLGGGKGWLDEEIHARIEKLRAAGNNIIQTGYVPAEDLPTLYTGATVFLLPSDFEGFGLPLLEAMACGTPVITCDNSSLPEVVGDAGVIVPTRDDEALSKAMDRVLNDPHELTRLRTLGFEQAKKYTWDASAKKLLAVIREVVGS